MAALAVLAVVFGSQVHSGNAQERTGMVLCPISADVLIFSELKS